MSAWTDFVERWKDCTDCPLCEQRDRICLARGSIPADVCFIGEAPGESENALGQPFVGRAGKLLDEIIEQAVPTNISYVLSNLVACFPAEAKSIGVNEPEQNEIEACRGRLIEFVHLANPKLIVCVGRLSSDNIADTIWEYKERYGLKEFKYVDIVHPAAITRMPIAQQQMAARKCVVQIKTAIEDLLNPSDFTNQGTNYASSQPVDLTAQYRNLGYQGDIPF